MLIVKTSLKEFKGKGIGLVAEELITKGQSVWKFNPIIDIFIKSSDIPEGMSKFFRIYGVRVKGGFYLNTDNARFINHSYNPNIKNLGMKKDNIALREIKPGEEITINYEEIEGPIDFEDIETNNER